MNKIDICVEAINSDEVIKYMQLEQTMEFSTLVFKGQKYGILLKTILNLLHCQYFLKKAEKFFLYH